MFEDENFPKEQNFAQGKLQKLYIVVDRCSFNVITTIYDQSYVYCGSTISQKNLVKIYWKRCILLKRNSIT